MYTAYQEHIAKIVQHLSLIDFWYPSSQLLSTLLIQNYECKMFPIHLDYILGTHRKNSSASFFDHFLYHNSEITTVKVLTYFLAAFYLYVETKLHAECSLYTQIAWMGRVQKHLLISFITKCVSQSIFSCHMLETPYFIYPIFVIGHQDVSNFYP